MTVVRNKMNDRCLWMDFLKGIAILFVIAVHCGAEGLPKGMHRHVANGSSWVQMFLLLTAILTFRSLERNFSGCSGSLAEYGRWIGSRFLRLAPLFYLAVLGCGLLEGGLVVWMGGSDHITPMNYIAHFCFLHGFVPGYADSIIGVEWYLGVIAVFYVLAPILFKWIRDIPSAFSMLVASVLLAYFVSDACFSMVDWRIPGQDYLWGYFSVFSPVASLPTICLGLSLFLFLRQDLSMVSWMRWMVAAALIAFFFMLYIELVKMPPATLHIYFKPQLLFAVAFTALILVFKFIEIPAQVLRYLPFGVVGRHCYGLYLFHFPLLRILDKAFPGLPWAARYFGCLFAAFVMTLVLERLVEKPIVRILGTRLTGLRKGCDA